MQTNTDIIGTSHDRFPPFVREIPLFQGILGWWNIIIWPDWWGLTNQSLRASGEWFSEVSSFPKNTSNNIGIYWILHIKNMILFGNGNPTTRLEKFTSPIRQELEQLQEMQAEEISEKRLGKNHVCDWKPLQASSLVKPTCSMGMAYLPTFTINLSQIKVNIPHMEHLVRGILLPQK